MNKILDKYVKAQEDSDEEQALLEITQIVFNRLSSETSGRHLVKFYFDNNGDTTIFDAINILIDIKKNALNNIQGS